jgi:hypothetical protein
MKYQVKTIKQIYLLYGIRVWLRRSPVATSVKSCVSRLTSIELLRHVLCSISFSCLITCASDHV